MSNLERAAIGLVLLTMTACPNESPTTDPHKDLPTDLHTNSPTNVAKPLSIAEPQPTGCEPAPVWVGIDACQEDGAVYATGRKTMASSGRLSRPVVAARARAAAGVLARLYAKDGKMPVNDGEVLYVHRCNDDWVALAKVPGIPPATIPACPKNMFERAAGAPEGCPPWAARIGWKDGETYFGVASSPATANAPLAQSAATARALTAARAVVQSVVGVDGRSATIESSSQSLLPVSTETATCDGQIYVMVAAKKNAAPVK